MRGTFVVQLWKATDSQLEGSVEDVEAGQPAKFVSEIELIAFLRERFAQIQAEAPTEGRNNESQVDNE